MIHLSALTVLSACCATLAYSHPLIDRAMNSSDPAEQISLTTLALKEKDVLASSLESANAYMVRANAYMTTGKLDWAKLDTDSAIKTDPSNASPVLFRAQILSRLDRCPEALNDVEDATRLSGDEEKADALYTGAAVMRVCSRPVKEIVARERAALKAARTPSLRLIVTYSLAMRLCRAPAKADEGLKLLSAVESQSKGEVLLLRARAYCLASSGKRSAALKDYDEALSRLGRGESAIRAVSVGPGEAGGGRSVTRYSPAMIALAFADRGKLRQAAADTAGARQDADAAVEALQTKYGAATITKDSELAAVYTFRAGLRKKDGDTPGARADYAEACRLGHKASCRQTTAP